MSWPAFRPDAYANPTEHLTRIRRLGFEMVALVPTYAYVGLNRIDHRSAPPFEDLSNAISAALEMGLAVEVKPHLDPPLYQPGFDPLHTRNHSWRAQCPWRGYFDVDPLSDAYLRGLMIPTLDAIARALERSHSSGEHVAPIRLELGSELMDSTVYQPERWAGLATRMREELHARGLEGRVLLSHDFSHHVEIPEDFLLRMNTHARAELARYVRSLDAVAVSQYMDLTVAVPEAERGTRLPTIGEVARALLRHEHTFRHDILEKGLGLKPGEVPPMDIGEFGIGPGGLSHPNLWQVERTEAEQQELREEVTRGHAGLLAYLSSGETSVRSAVLWVSGGSYDVFGWMNRRSAIPAVVHLYERFFARRRGTPTP